MALSVRRFAGSLLAATLLVVAACPAMVRAEETPKAETLDGESSPEQTRTPESVREELESIRKGIKEQKEREKLRDRKVARLLEDMRTLDDRLLTSARNREELKRQEKELERQKAARVDELDGIDKQYAELRGRLQKRLSSVYKRGRLGSTRVLAHAATSTEPLRIARYLAALSKADSSAIEEFEHVRYQKEAALRDIADKKEKLIGKRAALQDEADRYDVARKEKTMILAGLQEEFSADKSAVGKLQATEEQLEKLLASIPPSPPAVLEDEPVGPEPPPAVELAALTPPPPPPVSRLFHAERPAAPFEERKGDLEVPVRGRIVARFGEHTATAPVVQGLLVRSEHEHQVVAVARGEVVFSGPFPGLGSTVIINHGGRYHTVYAHLDSLVPEVGARVRENEVIGTLASPQPTLHFELRQAGKAQDPLAWFKGGKDAFVP